MTPDFREVSKPKLFFSILNQQWIHSDITIRLPRWLKECPYEVYFEGSNERPIEHNRNLIVKRFLDHDCTHLLMLDADTVPARNPLELVEYKKDIISAPAPIYQEKIFYNVYRQSEGDWLEPFDDGKGLIEVDATGTGCIMITREVLEKIKAPFERIFNEDGIETCGLDIAFSKKAKAEGYNIFTNFDYRCRHYKLIDLNKWQQ